MIVKLFQPQFAELVKSGNKRQTVRPLPKRLPQVGDAISLRRWSGLPYRSKQEILRESTLTGWALITIDVAPTMGVFIWIDRVMLSVEAAIKFARCDGFPNLITMREWFQRTHELPFTGIVLYWK